MNFDRILSQTADDPSFREPLNDALQAESLDRFVKGFDRLLEAKIPHHSICVSFNNLDYFSPWLNWDTQPSHYVPTECKDRYYFLNPTVSYLREHRGCKISSFSEHWSSLPRPHRNVYRERFMQHEGWNKYVQLHFWKDDKLEASVCVRRTRYQPDFGSDELDFLAQMHAAFSPCVRRLQNLRSEQIGMRSLRNAFLNLPAPLLVLDWWLKPIWFNFAARQCCLDWTHGPEHARAIKSSVMPDVPTEIIRCCDEQRRLLWDGHTLSPANRRLPRNLTKVPHPSRSELSAQVEIVASDAPDFGWPNFLVRLQKLPSPRPARPSAQAEDAGARGDDVLRLVTNLSKREYEVALEVCNGLSNPQIAALLHKSEATVKMQLNSVFRKLEIHNRTQLAMLIHP